MLDVFTIRSPALPRGTRVVGFQGSEGISRLYAFEIHLTLGPDEADAFDLASATGARATLVLDRQDGRPPFAFHGIFSEAALVHHQTDGRAIVRALLVPRLWRLTQTQHSRIFTGQSIPEIIKTTLEEGGLTSADYSLRLSKQYAPEEHVCQYRESSFDFLSRWMDREGIYYWFDQGDEGETLVVADDKAAHEDLAPSPVRFFALSGADASAREALHTFTCRHRSLPARVRLKDHDYTKPALDVSGSAPVSSAGSGEISVYGVRFFTPEAGQRLARIRAEEILAREQVFTGSGTAFHLRAGYTFSLQDHPRSSFDAKYLVTEAEHHGNQAASTPELRRITGLSSEDVYEVEVTAIPAAVQFRAESRTPWPRIYGTEHGVVDGEADSEYAQLDDQGRYLARFAFDESDLGDGKASTRVRMMQPHGGGVEGWHFPLRKGTEVLFTFLGGDPDRPVIAGVVPNAHKPSPVTKANHTRNVIQTGGRNRFELEDKAGYQRITLSTPHTNTMIRMGAPNADHNMILRTDGATLLDAGEDWDVTVGKSWHVNVSGKLSEWVRGEAYEIYDGPHTTQSWSTRTIEIGGPYTQTVYASACRTVNGDSTTTVTADDRHEVNGSATFKVGSNEKHTVGGDEVHEVSGGFNLTAGSPVTITAPKVTINGAQVSVKGNAHMKQFSSFTVEVFGSKNAIGAHKYDCTGLKMELTPCAIVSTGSKYDMTGFKVDNTAYLQKIGTENKTAPLSLKNFAICVGTFGFKKL